jgi:hypothetical protein
MKAQVINTFEQTEMLTPTWGNKKDNAANQVF